MKYQKIVQAARNKLKQQLQHCPDETFLILLIRIYKNLQCKHNTSIADRIYDFFQLYCPELTLNSSKRRLCRLIHARRTFDKGKLSNNESIGCNLSEEQIQFLNKILPLSPSFTLKKKQHAEVRKLIEEQVHHELKLLPKFQNIINNDILAAKLIEKAGSIKKLAFMSSNTIQLLGAEESFFSDKHPKHGILYESVQDVPNKGKAARQLANNISLTIKVDYFGRNKR